MLKDYNVMWMCFLYDPQTDYENASKTKFQIILAIVECLSLDISFCFLNHSHYFEFAQGFKLLRYTSKLVLWKSD